MNTLGIGIGVTAVIIVITLAILGTFSGISTNSDATYYFTNQSQTWLNATPVQVSNCLSGLSCTAVYNESTWDTLLTGTNVSCNGRTITVNNFPSGFYGNDSVTSGTVYVNYSCKLPSTTYNTTSKALTSLTTFAEFIPIIAVVLMGLLLVVFFRMY